MPSRSARIVTLAAATIASSAACTVIVDVDGLTGGDSSAMVDGGARAAGDAGRNLPSLADASSTVNDPASDAAPGSAPGDAAGDGAPTKPIDAGGGGPVDAAPDADPCATYASATALSIGAPRTWSPAYGGGGGTAFDESCPSGAAVVGFDVVTASSSPNSISQIEPWCAPLSVQGCSVLVGAASPIANQGYASGTPGSVRCPAGQVVVGVRARTGTLLDAITIDCAPLHAQRDASGVHLNTGAITLVGPVGGTGGGTNAPFDCPSPMVVDRVAGQWGDWIELLQLQCATPYAP